MAEQRAVCAAVPVRALLQLPLLGVIADIRVYTEVGGLLEVWEPLAATALGAADARTNEHYEIGTILTQKSQGGGARVRFGGAAGGPRDDSGVCRSRSRLFLVCLFTPPALCEETGRPPQLFATDH